MKKTTKKNYESTRGEKLTKLFTLALNMTTKNYTFDMIQKELDISTRNVYRVIKDLENVFGDAIKTRGVGMEQKTWRIGQTNSLEKMISFSQQQIALIEQYKKILNNKKISTEAIDAIITKMICLNSNKRHLTDADIEYLTETEDYVKRPLPHYDIDDNIIDTIQYAIDMCHVIECNYYQDDKDRIRKLEPYAIIHGTNTLIIAKEMDKDGNKAIKNYRLNRFNYAKDTKIEFEKDEDWSLKGYMKDCFGVFHGDEPIDVELKFSKKVASDVKKYHFHHSQILTENTDGTVNVNMHVCGKYELCWHLFTWGKEVQIIKPKELIDTYETLLNDALSTIKK